MRSRSARIARRPLTVRDHHVRPGRTGPGDVAGHWIRHPGSHATEILLAELPGFIGTGTGLHPAGASETRVWTARAAGRDPAGRARSWRAPASSDGPGPDAAEEAGAGTALPAD